MKSLINGAIGVLTGSAIGAGLMYLLDPEMGEKRRDNFASSASDAASSAQSGVGSALSGATHSAKSVASRIADMAHDLASHASQHLADVTGTVASTAKDIAGHVSSHAHNVSSTAVDSADSLRHNLSDRAADIYNRARRTNLKVEESHPARTATLFTSGTIGLLALGAGAMYFLDPAKGHARRAYVRDKVFSTTRRAGKQARSYGRHLGNRAQGAMHSAQGMVNDVKDSAAEVWSHASDATVE